MDVRPISKGFPYSLIQSIQFNSFQIIFLANTIEIVQILTTKYGRQLIHAFNAHI